MSSLQKANELSEEYSLRTPIVYTYQRMVDGVVGGIQTDVEYLMGLREESKYDNVERFVKVPILEEEQEVPYGWSMIHHTSKEVVLVKKGNQPKLSVIREALINAHRTVEDWDERDDNLSNNILEWIEVALGEIEGETKDESNSPELQK